MLLVLVFCFALAGCGDKDKPNKSHGEVVTYKETINEVEWTVTYDKSSLDVVQISAYTCVPDKNSKYYEVMRLMSELCCLCTTYSGVPVGDGWYLVVETAEYRTYDNCPDSIAQEAIRFFPYAKVNSKGAVVFCSRTIRYEEKLDFAVVA